MKDEEIEREYKASKIVEKPSSGSRLGKRPLSCIRAEIESHIKQILELQEQIQSRHS